MRDGKRTIPVVVGVVGVVVVSVRAAGCGGARVTTASAGSRVGGARSPGEESGGDAPGLAVSVGLGVGFRAVTLVTLRNASVGVVGLLVARAGNIHAFGPATGVLLITWDSQYMATLQQTTTRTGEQARLLRGRAVGGSRGVAGARRRVLGSSQGEQRGQSNKSELHFDKSETTDVMVPTERFVKGKKLAEKSNERRWKEKKKRKRRRRNNKRRRKQPGAKKQKNKAQTTAA